MSNSGSINLGDLCGKLTMLEIACSRCDRRGLLRLEWLIAEHGAGMGLPVNAGEKMHRPAGVKMHHGGCRASPCQTGFPV